MRAARVFRTGWLSLSVLGLLSFFLSCRMVASGAIGADAGSSLLDRLLTGSRAAASGTMYVRADQYFHKGVPHVEEAAFAGPFETLREAVAPSHHAHTKGSETREIIPWLRFAVRMDPHNVDAYCVAAYWLLKTGEDEAAHAALLEGWRNNPGDYRLMQEMARYALVRGDRASAARHLDAGINLWPSPLSGADEDPEHDLSWMLGVRAALYEASGQTAEALRCASRLDDLFPGRPGQSDYIARLSRGETDEAHVEQVLGNLFGAERETCHREENEAHEHGPDCDHAHDREHGHD